MSPLGRISPVTAKCMCQHKNLRITACPQIYSVNKTVVRFDCLTFMYCSLDNPNITKGYNINTFVSESNKFLKQYFAVSCKIVFIQYGPCDIYRFMQPTGVNISKIKTCNLKQRLPLDTYIKTNYKLPEANANQIFTNIQQFLRKL